MRQRLDRLLVARGLVQSRARAADLIARGAVRIGAVVAQKAGQLVAVEAEVAVDPVANAHVSRSGAKLSAALAHFKLDAHGVIALDIGASTGGFTQVLLESGARKVYAVDVGHAQLHDNLRSDTRVVSLEGQDARGLSRIQLAEPVTAIVADVSFVSLRHVLPAPLLLAASQCWLVALVKPQFEVGRGLIGKRGIVTDETVRHGAVHSIASFLEDAGWRIIGDLQSPLPGKEGNIEWLVGAVRDA